MSILTVGEMMSRDPVSVPPECPLRDAARVMRDMRIRSVLIKDRDEYVGIITGTDMAKRILAEEPYEGVAAGDVMSAPLFTIRDDEPLDRANARMVERHVRHLVVVDASGRTVGIISARDLLVPEEDVPGAIPFWPHHLLKEVVAALLVIALMTALVVASPAPMLHQADPFSTPAHIKPEWYFLAAYQFLKFAEIFQPMGEWAPKLLGVGIPMLVVLMLVFFPILDRNPDRAPRRRPIAMLIGVLATLAFVGFTVWGHFS